MKHFFPPAPPLPPPQRLDAESKRECLFLGFLLVIATVAAYHRLPGNLFVLYDDPEYITENARIAGGLTWNGILWAFGTMYQGNWHPLTWLSHMLDMELFGLNPAGHHLTALLLHLTNALLVLATLKKMTGSLWRSAAVAFLFALHPLHVESVAWAAERKDLLCALFWLLTMRAYLSYAQEPGGRRYGVVFLTFLLGLLAKPMLVTLPFVLLFLDYWPLRRTNGRFSSWRLVAEKLPLLALAAISSIVTFYAQSKAGTVALISHHSLFANVGNALISYVRYLAKTVYPVDLAIVYPFQIAAVTPVKVISAALFLLAVTLWTLRKKASPYLAVGWFWFLGALVPVIGLVRVGNASMADRYSYLPHIGLFIMLAWGVADLTSPSVRARRAVAGAAGGVAVLLAILTARQLRFWENGITLMEHAESVTTDNWFAYNNLGAAYIIIGTGNRVVNISASLPLEPESAERQEACTARAIDLFKESLRVYPEFPLAHFNLGLAYLRRGDHEGALGEYRRLLSLNPGMAEELRVCVTRRKR